MARVSESGQRPFVEHPSEKRMKENSGRLHFDRQTQKFNTIQKPANQEQAKRLERTTKKTTHQTPQPISPTKREIKAEAFKTSTEGVGNYFSGRASEYSKMIGSLKSYEDIKKQSA